MYTNNLITVIASLKEHHIYYKFRYEKLIEHCQKKKKMKQRS
jgi:hypothetical protein